MSKTGSYGMTDLGNDGIRTFFARHSCNEYCRRDWARPGVKVKTFTKKRGTTMLPDRINGQPRSRPPAQRIHAWTMF